MKKFSTSLKISKELEFTLQQRVISDGYGMRGKSKWVAEAVGGFITLVNFPEFVELADDVERLDTVVSFRLDSLLEEKINEAIVKVRTIYPTLEGVKSKIFRAGILQRLLSNPDVCPPGGQTNSD